VIRHSRRSTIETTLGRPRDEPRLPFVELARPEDVDRTIRAPASVPTTADP
jgi:hypothetical protein